MVPHSQTYIYGRYVRDDWLPANNFHARELIRASGTSDTQDQVSAVEITMDEVSSQPRSPSRLVASAHRQNEYSAPIAHIIKANEERQEVAQAESSQSNIQGPDPAPRKRRMGSPSQDMDTGDRWVGEPEFLMVTNSCRKRRRSPALSRPQDRMRQRFQTLLSKKRTSGLERQSSSGVSPSQQSRAKRAQYFAIHNDEASKKVEALLRKWTFLD